MGRSSVRDAAERGHLARTDSLRRHECLDPLEHLTREGVNVRIRLHVVQELEQAMGDVSARPKTANGPHETSLRLSPRNIHCEPRRAVLPNGSDPRDDLQSCEQGSNIESQSAAPRGEIHTCGGPVLTLRADPDAAVGGPKVL